MLVNLNDILYKAQREHYAVGLFNAIDSEMLQSTIDAAEELDSPIIIGTAEVLLPYGKLKLIAPSMISMAEKAKVPVVVHFDHGLTFDACMEALRLGFSSVMFDGSAADIKSNLKETAEVVRIAHAMGASVEGEIGHVGEGISGDNAQTDSYTTPKEAMDFLSETGVDALAIAIGTAHGVYKTKPKLDLERLKAIRENVDTPLVLHGGSGLSDEDFRNTVRDGITKINIFTDLCTAGLNAMREGIAENKDYLTIRDMRYNAIKQAVKNKITLFGSVNKA